MKVTVFFLHFYAETIRIKIIAFIEIHLPNLHRKSTSVSFTIKQDKLVQDIKDTVLFSVFL